MFHDVFGRRVLVVCFADGRTAFSPFALRALPRQQLSGAPRRLLFFPFYFLFVFFHFLEIIIE